MSDEPAQGILYLLCVYLCMYVGPSVCDDTLAVRQDHVLWQYHHVHNCRHR